MMNKSGPRTEPCGKPCRIGDGDDLVFLSCINSFLFEKYEMNHCNAVLVTPVPAKRSRTKIKCEIVSKVTLRSRRMRMEKRPESAA